jgi:hypothetical protein
LVDNGPFQLKEWIRRLIKWVVVDDQVWFCDNFLFCFVWLCTSYLQAINVVENKEFREFALYGHKDISDADLPHRTKLVELIVKEYEKEHMKLVNDFKACCFGYSKNLPYF